MGFIEVGKLLMCGVVDMVKKVFLELGGYVLFIVIVNVDLDKVVISVIVFKFCNVG